MAAPTYSKDGAWRMIVPFADPVPVSQLTILKDWFNVGQYVDVVQVTLINLDNTNEVQLLVEFTEDGVHPDSVNNGGTAPPQMSASAAFGPDDLQSVLRISAHTDGPGFPTALVQFQVKARMCR